LGQQEHDCVSQRCRSPEVDTAPCTGAAAPKLRGIRDVFLESRRHSGEGPSISILDEDFHKQIGSAAVPTPQLPELVERKQQQPGLRTNGAVSGAMSQLMSNLVSPIIPIVEPIVPRMM
jgi:hypothetical protein